MLLLTMLPPARLARAALLLGIGSCLVSLLAACHGDGAARLQGKWRGVRAEGVAAEVAAGANTFAAGTALEVKGDAITVTTPREQAVGPLQGRPEDKTSARHHDRQGRRGPTRRPSRSSTTRRCGGRCSTGSPSCSPGNEEERERCVRASPASRRRRWRRRAASRASIRWRRRWSRGRSRWVVRVGRTGRAPAAAINVASLGLVDHIEMRTRAIDAAVREGVEAGRGAARASSGRGSTRGRGECRSSRRRACSRSTTPRRRPTSAPASARASPEAKDVTIRGRGLRARLARRRAGEAPGTTSRRGHVLDVGGGDAVPAARGHPRHARRGRGALGAGEPHRRHLRDARRPRRWGRRWSRAGRSRASASMGEAVSACCRPTRCTRSSRTSGSGCSRDASAREWGGRYGRGQAAAAARRRAARRGGQRRTASRGHAQRERSGRRAARRARRRRRPGRSASRAPRAIVRDRGAVDRRAARRPARGPRARPRCPRTTETTTTSTGVVGLAERHRDAAARRRLARRGVVARVAASA